MQLADLKRSISEEDDATIQAHLDHIRGERHFFANMSKPKATKTPARDVQSFVNQIDPTLAAKILEALCQNQQSADLEN